MKRHVKEFIHRGLVAFGFGPMVLAVLYLILQHQGIIQELSVNQVCLGILSLSALAFIAGGMNFIYQIEQLPLMVAILIHGIILYVGYLVTYLLNGWLQWGMVPFLAFTGIFVFGYLVIWAIIYIIIRKHTARISQVLKEKQRSAD